MGEYSYESLERYSEYEDRAYHNIIKDLQERKKYQLVKKIPKGRLIRIWKHYANTQVISDIKGIDLLEEIFVYNVALLRANTVLCGHSPIPPKSLLQEYGLSDREIRGILHFLDNTWYRYFQHISDYGTERLIKLTLNLLSAQTPEKKLMYMDLMLNVIHQCSDLSELFVEGGSKTLDCLFYSYKDAMNT